MARRFDGRGAGERSRPSAQRGVREPSFGSALEVGGPSEEEIHREHRAALDATLFPMRREQDELILELDRGLLFLRECDV